MRQIFFIIFLLSIGMKSHAQEAKLDSASYAYGDKIVRSIIESPDSVFPGFEYNKKNLAEINFFWFGWNARCVHVRWFPI